MYFLTELLDGLDLSIFVFHTGPVKVQTESNLIENRRQNLKTNVHRQVHSI